jgi:hypothetical protein
MPTKGFAVRRNSVIAFSNVCSLRDSSPIFETLLHYLQQSLLRELAAVIHF